jgi:hypothetical protein
MFHIKIFSNKFNLFIQLRFSYTHHYFNKALDTKIMIVIEQRILDTNAGKQLS